MAKQDKTAPTDPMDITVADDPNLEGDFDDEDLSGDDIDVEDDADETEDSDDSDTSEDVDDDEDTDDSEEDDDDAGDDEDDDDPKYVSIEDYKKLQSASTKGAQKLLGKVKAQKEAFKLLPKLATNQEELLSVYEETPEVAEVILENYYDGITIEQFAKDYLGQDYTDKSKSNKEDIDPEKLKEDTRKEVMREIRQEENDNYLGELIAEAKVNTKQAKKIMEEYQDIVNGRLIDKSKVKKYFQTAYYEVVGKRLGTDKTAKVVKSTAVKKGGGGGKPSKKSDQPKHVQDSVAFLKKMGY